VTRKRLSNLNVLAVPSPPPVGISGDLYYNTSTKSIYTSDGVSWTLVGGSASASVTIGDTPPLGPTTGDLWYDSVLGSMFIWYDSYWVDIAGNGDDGVALNTAIHAFTSKTADYLATSNDEIIAADASTGPSVTITLPDATGLQGRQYTVKKTDSSAFHVIVATTGALIDGFPTQSLTVQYEALTVVSDGSNWLIV
jgi:hypothetical protein